MLLIEHDMGLVMKVCEKLLVLEYGSLIASGFGPTSCAAILKLLKPIWGRMIRENRGRGGNPLKRASLPFPEPHPLPPKFFVMEAGGICFSRL